MTPQIKQRIEQIKRGEVPAGYKKTKVGIVPEEWNTPKAKDVFQNVSDKNHDGTLEVLSATQDKGVIPRSQVDIDIKYDKSSVSSYKKVSKGNFVISLRSFQGGIEYSEYDGLISPAYTILQEKNKINQYFFKTYFKSNDYIRRLAVATYGIRDGKSISYDDFGMLNIPLPPLAEQEKIAKILQTQDRIIELQQRKIDELKKLKKVYLSKMIPKKGQKTPEWRFKGFNDDWEQRKVGEVFKEYSVKKHAELPPLTIIQGQGTVKRDEVERDIHYDKANLSSYKVVNPNDFIVHLRSFEGGFERANTKGIVSPAYHIFHGENIDSRFYYAYFRSSRFICVDLKPHVYGIRDGKSIDIEGMKTIKISYPSYGEQKFIGDLLENFNNLITLHQRKLDEMKNYKKSLMQLLLTGIVRV